MKKTDLLEKMEKDRVHGSSWYFDMALAVLEKATPETLQQILQSLSKLRPMGSLTNIVSAFKNLATEEQIHGEILRLKNYRETARQNINKHLKNLHFEALITISYSSAVLSLLKYGAVDKVYLMESRPGTECRKALKEYSKYAKTVIVPDSAICVYMELANAAVIGADAVYSAGILVNKIGSRPLVACANMLHVPAYAIAESYKASDVYAGISEYIEFKYAGQSMKISMFEKIELQKINYLISDIGIFKNPENDAVVKMHENFLKHAHI